MKIGINARFLTKPFTGIGQYTRNLLREMAMADQKTEFLAVVAEPIQDTEMPENVRIVVVPEKKFGSAGMRKTWWEQVLVPQFFVANKVDLAFFPYVANTWWRRFRKKFKTVETVHDCIPWKRKEYRKGILSAFYHSMNRRAVAKADLVLTVSEVSKKDIVKICHVKPEKVKVVYNDASPTYKNKARETVERENFFLYVGGYDERKNVKYLLEEYGNFQGDTKLMLAGGKLFENDLYRSFDQEKDTRVVRTGFLKEEELKDLYQNCLAFINLSQEEGFNIPILEAANCGAPLILSDIEVHREIAGEMALFVDIQQSGKAVDAMNLMMDTSEQKKFEKKSQELAEKYLWKNAANVTIRLMKDVLFSH